MHLIHIHNSNIEINNLTLTNGNTAVIRDISNKMIPFYKPKRSVFEIIDGGAVLITGKSNVTFNNCEFRNNNALMCGGAISNQSSEKAVFNNCVFENNTAGHTGSAIDNLTTNAVIEVNNCKCINNISNLWNKSGYPHGHITVFPHTTAIIKDSYFKGGSIPIDYTSESNVTLIHNKYVSYANWNDMLPTKRSNSILNRLNILMHLYWLPFKTGVNVKYKVNN